MKQARHTVKKNWLERLGSKVHWLGRRAPSQQSDIQVGLQRTGFRQAWSNGAGLSPAGHYTVCWRLAARLGEDWVVPVCSGPRGWPQSTSLHAKWDDCGGERRAGRWSHCCYVAGRSKPGVCKYYHFLTTQSNPRPIPAVYSCIPHVRGHTDEVSHTVYSRVSRGHWTLDQKVKVYQKAISATWPIGQLL